MTTRMLIDARHQEETRVAVVKGGKIEEFDFESAEHKQLKGNIYLAKITRVEPSLQAAFVDYGGNRHGFLAFNEIHPDYYNIPKEDRDALLAEEAEHAAEEAALRAQEEDSEDAPLTDADEHDEDEVEAGIEEVEKDDSVDTIDVSEGEMPEDGPEENDEGEDEDSEAETGEDADAEGGRHDGEDDNRGGRRGQNRRGRSRGRGGPKRAAKASDQARAKRLALRRRYKIQDVIQRRQVVLVQVVKEERGNKGAALTTYLSLAGRYCVLMPNTSHGGGISRKISSASDRKRLKNIVDEMKLPSTMGCIVRTAGAKRTKPEIKRDFDYLARLWDEIREKTLSATAPALIHSDSELIKRAIRDIYNRDISEVLVEGEDGYRAAKDFMKLLMPSHSRRVKHYADPVSLFQRYGVEDQLSAMYQPEVQLKSGGYLVINPTEALVSIDINSGKSTREHGIEQTALKTNIEAAQEIARQLRLRDMAGLVVIDFIDMDRHGNIRKVEKALRDALKNDRARIQVGRISSFGLLEMSRQRLRTGVLEASTHTCPACEGTGLVRTASSAGLTALRMIEEAAAAGKATQIALRASQDASIYVLNQKRKEIEEIEKRYGVSVEVLPDPECAGARMEVTTSGPPPKDAPKFEPVVDEDEPEEAEDTAAYEDEDEQQDEQQDKPKRKRRRRGRRGRGRKPQDNAQSSDDQSADSNDGDDDASGGKASDDGEAAAKPAPQAEAPAEAGSEAATEAKEESAPAEADVTGTDEAPAEAEAKPKRRRSRARKKPEEAANSADETSAETASEQAATDEAASDTDSEPPAKPKRRRRAPAKKDAAKETATAPAAEAQPEPEQDKAEIEAPAPAASAPEPVSATTNSSEGEMPQSNAEQPDSAEGGPRKGWWQRTFG